MGGHDGEGSTLVVSRGWGLVGGKAPKDARDGPLIGDDLLQHGPTQPPPGPTAELQNVSRRSIIQTRNGDPHANMPTRPSGSRARSRPPRFGLSDIWASDARYFFCPIETRHGARDPRTSLDSWSSVLTAFVVVSPATDCFDNTSWSTSKYVPQTPCTRTPR